MIGWSTIAPGLRDLFSRMATDQAISPEFAALWAEGPQEFTHPDVGMTLQLKITSVVGVGLDELRYEDVDGELVERVVGHRRFTLQTRVESHIHGFNDESTTAEGVPWCWTMTERLRTSIRRSRNREALEALNVSLVDIGPAVDAAFKFNKRRVNAAVCDYFLMTAICDEDPIKPGVIEHVELTSLIKNVDGVLLPSPPNLTEEVIPPLP